MLSSAPTEAEPPHPTHQLFEQGDRLPPRTDVLWRIERGIVRTLTRNEEGELFTSGYWGPGDVVGHALSRVNPYEIYCLTSVKTSVLPSKLWCQLLDKLVLHHQQLEEMLIILHQPQTPQKLWQFLIWLAHKFGREVEQGRLIELRITHQEFAEVISTTRVTVTRTLQLFESKGMLRRYQKQLIVCAQTQQTLW
ncbi:MAG: Crp/Fnr family transcriptional regulator [Chroococcidiopsidaceae cyanobacterium CP_BM_RX_35]|nr:Crp/Fnr family transcriptional regulator [Chroococcidiopsidaceae cyanobacterium CP_BM_RX_35]